MNEIQQWFAVRGLVRARRGRWLFGVCEGLGMRYGMPGWLVRLVFVASCLLPGPQLIVYIALAILMPVEGDTMTATRG